MKSRFTTPRSTTFGAGTPRSKTSRSSATRSIAAQAGSSGPVIRRFGLGRPRQTAAEARAMLRHPRSLIRINPSWRAPSFYFGAGDSAAFVHLSRRRLSALMWQRLCQQQPPAHQELFLVTLSAECPRWMEQEVSTLLGMILGQAWTVREDPQEYRDRNHQPMVRLTWHALATEEDLQAGSSSTQRVA